MRLVTKRAAILTSTTLVVACVVAGSVIAARVGGTTDLDALSSATRAEPLTRVADIAAGNGKPARGVFAQVTSTGHFCLWDALSASSLQRQGGCNSVDDPLGGHALSASLAYDGGPAAVDVTDASLVGLAAPEVAEVQVVMSDGTRRTMSLRETPRAIGEFQAFGHRFGRGEIKRGVTPAAVVALNDAGVEIDRQETGF